MMQERPGGPSRFAARSVTRTPTGIWRIPPRGDCLYTCRKSGCSGECGSGSLGHRRRFWQQRQGCRYLWQVCPGEMFQCACWQCSQLQPCGSSRSLRRGPDFAGDSAGLRSGLPAQLSDDESSNSNRKGRGQHSAFLHVSHRFWRFLCTQGTSNARPLPAWQDLSSLTSTAPKPARIARLPPLPTSTLCR